jgi:glutaredoxin 2
VFGAFPDLIAQTPDLVAKINDHLKELEPMFYSSQFVNENGLSYDDIDHFGRLRNLTIVKGIIWPPKIRAFLDFYSQQTDVRLLDDIAKI